VNCQSSTQARTPSRQPRIVYRAMPIQNRQVMPCRVSRPEGIGRCGLLTVSSSSPLIWFAVSWT
jgi:hypothetical protein